MKLFKFLSIFTSITFIALSSNARPVHNGFADLVEGLMPSVVNISTTQNVSVSDSPFGMLFEEFGNIPNSPFGDLPDILKRFGQNPSDKKVTKRNTSLGSGFVITANGFIVTNNHVIEKADEITVVFSDETEAVAKIVGRDPKTDTALLKVEIGKKLKPIKWGDSDKMRAGDWVIAIGNPYGLGGSVSAGIISARARDINAGPFDDFLQTDAAINKGNSGGPLFNSEGEVIGINTAIFSPSGGSVGIGFSVPSALSRPVINQLREHGRTYRGWLGVKIQSVSDEIAESLGLNKNDGALVLEVVEDSPAAKGKILPGDIILKFDGKQIETMRNLPRIVAETKVGSRVNVEVLRNGKMVSLKVKIDELEEESNNEAIVTSSDTKKSKEAIKDSNKILAMNIADVEKSLLEYFKLNDESKGVLVVKVEEKSDAYLKGIRAGDIIKSINQKPVSSVKETVRIINGAIKSGRKSVLLLIERKSQARFVAVKTSK